MTVRVPLSSPVQAHGEPISALELRAPTGETLRRCGVPFSTVGGETILRAAAASAMISDLAAVPSSTVDDLAGADWLQAAMAVVNLCSPAAAAPVLRQPTGKTLRSCGVPFTIGEVGASGEPAVTIYAEATAQLIAELGGMTPEAVDAMPAGEWMAAAMAVCGFFGAATRKPS